jgi:dethiobiotin synthetase
MKRFFVTGTDTGVGKTHVTRLLIERARQLGRRVVAIKPIETGTSQDDPSSDRALLAVATATARVDLEVLHRPVSPYRAALSEDRVLDVASIVARIEQLAMPGDLLVVEGAGGWRVPITREHMMSDLARALRAHVVLVGRAGLGTINHTVLSIEAIERDQLPLAAVLLSTHPEDDQSLASENAVEIQRMTQLKAPIELCDVSWPARLDTLLTVPRET